MPIWLIALAGAGAYFGYRAVKSSAQLAADQRARRQQMRAKADEPRNLGELKLDEKSGEYRPR
ncbi:MAG: hypothetical protein AAFQ45_05200 [Pseudomonadota bacterium]